MRWRSRLTFTVGSNASDKLDAFVTEERPKEL
jgi:hypothetical protein